MSDAEKKILVLNGPNLSRLGSREPSIYGDTTLDAIIHSLRTYAEDRGWHVEACQSNHEGALIDWIEAAAGGTYRGIILNAGGLTHTSVSLHDAVKACPIPVIEVHLSNIFAREGFRRESLLAPVCAGIIAGFGPDSYHLALIYLIEFLLRNRTTD